MPVLVYGAICSLLLVSSVYAQPIEMQTDTGPMVLIPAGAFVMGSDDGPEDEQPMHAVYLDAFWIDQYEVAIGHYAAFLNAGYGRHYVPEMADTTYGGIVRREDGSYMVVPGRENYPMTRVTYDDAIAYAEWADKRLPTEAEWEKAARGTDGRRYPWGNELPNAGGIYRCNYKADDDLSTRDRDGYASTSPVGSFSAWPSPYGVMDMAGNVREWCSSFVMLSGPLGDTSYFIMRGGSLGDSGDGVRCTVRYPMVPTDSHRYFYMGFRCARDAASTSIKPSAWGRIKALLRRE